jgi:hypothetical protein
MACCYVRTRIASGFLLSSEYDQRSVVTAADTSVSTYTFHYVALVQFVTTFGGDCDLYSTFFFLSPP